MKRVVLAGVALAVALLTTAGTASASTVKVCVPKKEGSAIVTPRHGKCKKGYRLTRVAAEGKEGKPGGPSGLTGPTGPAGTAGRETAAGTLASGKSETGTWSVVLNAPAGSHQEQAYGTISYPTPLPPTEKPTLVYKNEAESKEPSKPAPGLCEGSVEEPVAREGFLCVYSGGGGPESENTQAEFVGFMKPAGELTAGKKVAGPNRFGELLVFRTKAFEPAPSPPVTLAVKAYFSQEGSWAVKSK